MVHGHIAYWIRGAPRIDRVTASPAPGGDEMEPEAAADESVWEHLAGEGEVVMEQGDAANQLADFFDRVYTEYNLQKSCIEKHGDNKNAARVGRRQRLGKARERSTSAPDMLSEQSLRILLGKAPNDMPDAEWAELDRILVGGDMVEGEMCTNWRETRQGDSGLSYGAKCARARRAFVAALAEWTQMHDFHAPFAHGPPNKGQSCAKVDNEHSKAERVSCGKLFPRKLIPPGQEEVQEDPRRRELYRLWLGRNCNFINNFIPIISLATLANMDFQATITKFGVIEYMTKYMTKSGQGSLLGVMEHSFSLCMEKAREHQQGAGAAILRWFNMQSTTDVKSQLETMHLAFRLPRFLSSRTFKRLAIRSEVKKLITKDAVLEAGSMNDGLTSSTPAELYLRRSTICRPPTLSFSS